MGREMYIYFKRIYIIYIRIKGVESDRICALREFNDGENSDLRC